MPYTLVPIVDIGPSLSRPGRQRRAPLGMWEQGGGHSIHLGDDWAILWTVTDVADGRADKLAESPDEALGGATRTRLRQLRNNDGRAIPTRFGDAVADMLVVPPAGRWNPLVATREGMLEVRLGPGVNNVLWSQPGLRGGVDVTDTFTRTGNLDGSTTSDAQTTWVEDQGTALTVDGDEVDVTGNVGFCVGRLALAMASADHYAEADISRFSWSAGGLAVAVVVRANATPTSGYGFEVGTNAGPNHFRRLYNFVTDADIAADTTQPATGLIYLEFNGSTYTVKVGGSTIFTNTNTTFDGTVKGVGLTGFTSNAANSAGITSFRGADLSAGPTNTDRNPLVVAVTLAGLAPANVYGTLIEVPTP